MHPLIADNLDAIHTLAREYGVARLEVFGSVTTGAFDSERSDIDFLVT
jgi:predicted nucleotidyltransferase